MTSRSRQEFVGGPVGRTIGVRRARRRPPGQHVHRRREPRIDADERLPIRLVLAVRIAVVRGLGQREQLRRRMHEARGQRQLAAQPMHFVQIMVEGNAGLRADRVVERVGDDERIAVAVAADPRAHAQERRQRRIAIRTCARCQRPGLRTAAAVRRGTCTGNRRGHCRSRRAPAASTVAASPSATATAPADTGRSRTPTPRPASAACGRATSAVARSRARSRGCSCAAPRSDARSAPARSAPRRATRRARSASRRCFATLASAAATLPACGGDPAYACARRRRFWCTSSAMLLKCEKYENARTTSSVTGIDRSLSSAESSARTAAASAGAARRKRIAVWRTASMRA